MQKARKLLTQTFLSIKEIASRAGYGSVQSFCRDFRHSNGCTARDFRNRFGIG
jgi:AraC-like DNA-binding protein